MAKRTEQNLIVRNHKSEAKVITNDRRLHSMYCIIEDRHKMLHCISATAELLVYVFTVG